MTSARPSGTITSTPSNRIRLISSVSRAVEVPARRRTVHKTAPARALIFAQVGCGSSFIALAIASVDQKGRDDRQNLAQQKPSFVSISCDLVDRSLNFTTGFLLESIPSRERLDDNHWAGSNNSGKNCPS